MAESWITYSISRPYPYRWITPVVVVGTIAVLALFSYLNFASSGFYLTLQYVSDPNKTVADAAWLKHWPAYFTTYITPTCQPREFQINDAFSTNQSALLYKVVSAWILSESGTPILQPGLTYMNNPIEDCEILNIHIDFEAEDRTPTQYGWNAWGQVLQAFITCSIKTEMGFTYFNLTTDYDFVPSTAQFPTGQYDTQVGIFSFLTRNATTKASLWWGESLLAQYWSYTSTLIQDARQKSGNNLRKGTIHFMQNGMKDITALDFWHVDSRFMTNTDVQNMADYWDQSGVNTYPMGGNLSEWVAASTFRPDLRTVWHASDGLAKSFYSVILADLGQINVTPNILTDENTLQHFTQNFTLMQDHTANAQPGPARGSYNDLRDETGPLQLSPSVIASKYICQVPKRKSPGTLFWSILVADLVLLQAAWKLFSIVVSSWLTYRNPEADYCAGCTKRSLMYEGVPKSMPESRSLIAHEEIARPSYEVRHGVRVREDS